MNACHALSAESWRCMVEAVVEAVVAAAQEMALVVDVVTLGAVVEAVVAVMARGAAVVIVATLAVATITTATSASAAVFARCTRNLLAGLHWRSTSSVTSPGT